MDSNRDRRVSRRRRLRSERSRAASAGTTRRDWRDNERVARLLDEVDLLHLAVSTERGPHVTPSVFRAEGGRLWLVVSRRSVKARAAARRSSAGAMVQEGKHAVMLTGRTRIVDPLTLRGVGSTRRLLELPFAAAGYLGRQQRHALGVLEDRQAPTLPLARIAVVVDVERVALLDAGTVVATWGRWDRRELLLHGAAPTGRPPALAGLPSGPRSLLAAADRSVVLGWTSLAGPIAVPARWHGNVGLLETSAEALSLAGAPSGGPACVTADRSGPRLSEKQGVLLRGRGRVRVEGEKTWAHVEPERVTWWIGGEVGTITRSRTEGPIDSRTHEPDRPDGS